MQLENLKQKHLGPEQIKQQNQQYKGLSEGFRALPNGSRKPGMVFKCY